MSKEPPSVTANLWPLQTNGLMDKEAIAVGERFDPPWIGVCISGGGSRSLSAAMGQLRGLHHLGLMENVSWLSCVSGGCWASTLYTYLPETVSDDTFLGSVAAPETLLWDSPSSDPGVDLSHMDADALGSVPQRLGWDHLLKKALEFREEGIPEDRMWANAIGDLVLAPFGLGDSPDRYFSWTEKWLEENILVNNREPNNALSKNDFVLTRDNRPYLITNATLFYPPNATSGPFQPDPLSNPYLIESTPMGVGVATTFLSEGAPNTGQQTNRDIGGGWVDSFAYGGNAPTRAPVDGKVTLEVPEERYRLSDAAGNSSSAFVATIIDQFGSQYDWLEKLVPVFKYWPVHDAADESNSAHPYFFGDGGNFEDTGIAALVRRKLPRIVSFINGSTPLGWDDSVHQVSCDSQLATLFGYAPKENGKVWERFGSSSTSPHRFAQIFDAEAFLPLLNDLWDAHTAGASAVSVCKDLKVVDNKRLGIIGDFATDVLFVVNTPVKAWHDALSIEVRAAMEIDPEYHAFPNYDTLLQLHLNERQVNLLAHLSCWNVVSEEPVGGRSANAKVFQDFFS